MKILIIGSTGRVGTHLVQFGLDKGFEITAFARNVSNLDLEHPNLRKVQGDVLYPALVESAVTGQDAVISVVGIRQFRGPITLLSTGIQHTISAMEKCEVSRLLTITGAGILQENSEELIMESLSFPPNLQNVSLDHLRVFKKLENSSLDWTIASPAFMHNGERSGKYIVKEDYYPPKSQNQVSVEDVADFLITEVEANKYLHKRVGIAHPIES